MYKMDINKTSEKKLDGPITRKIRAAPNLSLDSRLNKLNIRLATVHRTGYKDEQNLQGIPR